MQGVFVFANRLFMTGHLFAEMADFRQELRARRHRPN